MLLFELGPSQCLLLLEEALKVEACHGIPAVLKGWVYHTG